MPSAKKSICWILLVMMSLPPKGFAHEFHLNPDTGHFESGHEPDSGSEIPEPTGFRELIPVPSLEDFLRGTPLSQPEPAPEDPQGIAAVPEPVFGETLDPRPYQETAGQVVLEAEHSAEKINRNGISWNFLSTAAGFSGDGYYQAAPDTGKSFDTDLNNKSPELKYNIYFDHPGTYYLWVRANAPDSKGDSLHVGLESTAGLSSVRSYVGSQGSFGWSKATMDGARASFQVTQAGVHTVHVWMREDGLLLDKLLFTQDAAFNPSNPGPGESARRDSGTLAAPVIDPVFQATNQSALTLSGTKPANTSVWINGVEAAALSASTSWSVGRTLSQEQLYTFSVTVRDSSGNESSPATASITYDITAPVILFDSPSTTGNADYLLVYRVDGTSKSKSFTLVPGSNILPVTETDLAGNQVSTGFMVTYNPSTPSTPAPFQENGGVLVIEAEHPHGVTNRAGKTWSSGNAVSGFSGDGYFQASPDTAKSYDGAEALANSPVLSYNIYVNSPGIFYVWVRGYAPDAKGDSVHAGLDGALPDTSDRISFSQTGVFMWSKVTMDKVRPSVNIVTSGLHSIQIVMREDGFIADKILLTKDANFTPVNAGPPESGRRENTPVDTTPPAGALNINSGASYAISPAITLSIDGSDSGSGLDAMRFSTDGGASWSAWEPFAISRNLTLPSGDGTKEVRMQLRDLAGLTANFSDSVFLDTLSPSGSIVVNNGNAFTTTSPVTLTLTGSDSGSGVDQMRFSTNNGSTWTAWENFVSSKSLPVPAGDGSKTVLFQLSDKAGLVTNFSDSIFLDTSAPSATVRINSGDTYAASRTITVNNDATDAGTGVSDMRFSLDGAVTWSSWEAYAALKNLTLPSGEGTKTVFAEFRDAAGFVRRVSDSIFLDTVLPAGSVRINSGSAETASRTVTLTLTASDGGAGLDKVRYSTDNGASWTGWESFSSSKSVTLTGNDGMKNVLYEVRDRALNTAQFSDRIVFENATAADQSPVLNPGGVFTLSLNDAILQRDASEGIGGAALSLSQKFFGTFSDLYDFVIMVPTSGAAVRLSLKSTANVNENGLGSFYLPALNDIEGIGQDLFNYRNFYGLPASGEFEGLVMLNSAVNLSDPKNIFSTSDFSDARNTAFFANILTQEILHRFGSFLTSEDGNPLGLLGRDLAHWGAFFDADFSPMDGNDWVDNGNGTFTLARSYYDEAAFIRADRMMPYNDLDLYAMGVLGAGQVAGSFVIDNPVHQGRRVRPHKNDPAVPNEGGPFVDVEVSPGVWQGPVYLNNGVTVTGTRRNITLPDLVALDGARNPAPAAPKTFKVAFVGVTDETEDAGMLAAFMSKLEDFQNSFLDFFRTAARNLASLTLPSLSLPGGSGGFPGGEAGPLGLTGSSAFTPLYWDALKPLREFSGFLKKKRKKTQSV